LYVKKFVYRNPEKLVFCNGTKKGLTPVKGAYNHFYWFTITWWYTMLQPVLCS